MVELAEPVSVEPVRATRKYYVAVPSGETAASPRAQTEDRFGADNLTENAGVVEDVDWKLDLHEYTVLKTKWIKDTEDWKEESDRVYHLVLTHCPPELEAKLPNHLKWAGGKSAQNFIDLLLMIRNITHDMNETKQETTTLVERAIELFMTAQKPSDSIKDYYEISTAQKDIVEAEAAKCSSEAFLARLFVLMADNKRYKPLKNQLDNDYLL